MNDLPPISLAITGASGSLYGLRLLETLLGSGRRVWLMVSDAARIVIPTETDFHLPTDIAEAQAVLTARFGAAPGQLRLFGRDEWTAPPASGSNPPAAMAVCPCSTGILSAIACGASNNLIERAADVMLKERRPLVLVVRETPFSAIHLENMLKLARLGVTILPASPGFYQRPQRVEELVDFIVARVLDQLGVDHRLGHRWGSETPNS